MTTWITVCDTCKSESPTTDGPCGERLAQQVEVSAAERGLPMRRVSCLMSCSRGCAVAVQAQGKLCYTLGGFEPTQEAALAIVEYAALHAQSTSGQVPYRAWPEGVKGHFVTRHLPLPT